MPDASGRIRGISVPALPWAPSMDPTNTVGGGVDHRAVIGHAPESRDWRPGDPAYPPVIHETARVEAFATIDAGKDGPTQVGARSWIFKHAHLGHDVTVCDDVEISTGAIIGGHCHIGDGARIGIGAVLKPWVRIGEGARIGCGSVVVKDVPEGEVWCGNPARKLR